MALVEAQIYTGRSKASVTNGESWANPLKVRRGNADGW